MPVAHWFISQRATVGNLIQKVELLQHETLNCEYFIYNLMFESKMDRTWLCKFLVMAYM